MAEATARGFGAGAEATGAGSTVGFSASVTGSAAAFVPSGLVAARTGATALPRLTIGASTISAEKTGRPERSVCSPPLLAKASVRQ